MVDNTFSYQVDNIQKLLDNAKKHNKSIILLDPKKKYANLNVFSHDFINLSALSWELGIIELFFAYIYPMYSEKKAFYYYIEESFDDFKAILTKKEDKEVNYYGFSLYADKIIWHLKYNAFFIEIESDYSLTELFLTPIEKLMQEALIEQGLTFVPQKEIGNYTLDFFVTINNQDIAVECDGAEYHEQEKDLERDRILASQYGIPTIRFTGSEIVKSPRGCVSTLIEKVESRDFSDYFNKETLNLKISEMYDNQQVLAIKHLYGPCVVLAPAGSGKTAVLIQRIIELIKRGVNPESILATTFTKKAMKEIKDRLTDVLGDIAKKVKVYTYHGLAYKYLAKNRSLIEDRFLWKIFETMEQNNKKIGKIKPELIDAIARKIINLKPIDSKEELVLNSYRKALYMHNTFTFDILLIEFVELLKHDDVFRKNLQLEYEFVLIDESQDNNKSQQFISKVIAAPQDNLFWVGDDDQCIFSFTGSSIDSILELSNEYIPLRKIYLEHNYRSDAKIVDSATNVIVSNNKRALKVIKPGPNRSYNDNSVEYLMFNTAEQEAKHIARYCKNYASTRKKIAILTRTKYYAQYVINELRKLNVKFYNRDQVDLFRVPIIKILHSYLCCLNGKGTEVHMKEVLRHGLPYVSNEEISTIIQSQDFFTGIKKVIANLPENKKFKANKWTNFEPTYKLLEKNFNKSSKIIDQVNYINTSLNLLNDGLEEEHKQALQIYKSIVQQAKSISELKMQIEGVNAQMEDLEDDFNVLIFTIHSSKGKQFDTVFLIGLTEGILPSSKAHEIYEQEEERRVCYVAITRAINKIFLTYSIEQGLPSRYIAESKEPKMDCVECFKSIAKKAENVCQDCNDYYCSEHMSVCHNCKRTICLRCSLECSCGENLCSYCQQINQCGICSILSCPTEFIKCSVCSLILCKEHQYSCNRCDLIFCHNHVVKCCICEKNACLEHSIVCEWCGKVHCEGCYKHSICKSCGHTYCNSCIDFETEKCDACNKRQVHTIEELKNIINDVSLFGKEKQVDIGISSQYFIYYRKRLFGLLRAEPIRILRKP